MSASTYVTLETALGAFTLELFGQQAPLTTANFLAYVDSGRYDGSSIFRIVNPVSYTHLTLPTIYSV